MQGTIASLSVKGYGFIAGADGRRYFFHLSALEGGVVFEGLVVGQEVDFEASEDTDRGFRAEAVRLV